MSLHLPVMCAQAVAALALRPGAVAVDGTFGRGGHAAAILAADVAALWAFDRDPEAIAHGAEQAAAEPRLHLVHARFSAMDRALEARGVATVDAILLDLGTSSPQLDDGARGFAFSHDGPLDMRMEAEGVTAADWLNAADEDAIAAVLKAYGEEPRARRVARAIVAARPLARTGELAAVIRRALGWHAGMPRDPATRSFQAIRIHVNDELTEVAAGLRAAERLLVPGGRLAVISFHSLEDRVVKAFLRERGGAAPGGSRHLPAASPTRAPSFAPPPKAARPSANEIASNPRARSATLRVAKRTAAAAWETPR